MTSELTNRFMKNLFKKKSNNLQHQSQESHNKQVEDDLNKFNESNLRQSLIPPRRGSLYDTQVGMDSDTSPIIPINNNSSNENVKDKQKSPRNSSDDQVSHMTHNDNNDNNNNVHNNHSNSINDNNDNNVDSIEQLSQPQSPFMFSPVPRVATPKGLTLPPFSPFNPLAHPPNTNSNPHSIPPPINSFSTQTPPTSPRDVRRAARHLPTLSRASSDHPNKPNSNNNLSNQTDSNQESADISDSDDIEDSDESESDQDDDDNLNHQPHVPPVSEANRSPPVDYFTLPLSQSKSPNQTPRPAPPLSPHVNPTTPRPTTSSVLPPKLNQRTASSVTIKQRSRENTQSSNEQARISEDSTHSTNNDDNNDDNLNNKSLQRKLSSRRLTSSIMITAIENPEVIEVPNRSSSHNNLMRMNRPSLDQTNNLTIASPKVYGRQMSRSLTDLSSFQAPDFIEGLGVAVDSITPSPKGKEKLSSDLPNDESNKTLTDDDQQNQGQQLISTREIGVSTSPLITKPYSPNLAQSSQMEAERRNWRGIIENTPLSPPPPLTPLPNQSSPSAKRRLSLPNLNIPPPNYEDVVIKETIFGGIRRVIRPREEEGRENLPTYRCGIHIEGLMPRKMEFTSPGCQARDRTWRRVYVVLHGTVLKIYKADRWDHERAAAASEISDISEADHESVYVHPPPPADAPIPPVPTLPQLLAQRPSFQNHISAPPNHVKYAPTLLRTYTLQNAESGLAADYVKRKNVIRVRLVSEKGVKEQFLIQAYDQSSVIDWIEALQAATNISLDLDQRPMPKLTTLPRRRRRRRIRQEDLASGNINNSNNADILEAAQTEAAIQESLRAAQQRQNNSNGDNSSSRSFRDNIRSIRRNASQLRPASRSNTSVNIT